MASFDELLQDLAHPNPNIREQACQMMADQHPDLALPKLLELIHDPDPQIYRTAVKGIGVVGHSALPDLLQLFDSSDSGTVRACCIKALVQIAVNFPDQLFSSDVLNVLEKALDDPSPVVAQSSLMTLGYLAKQAGQVEQVVPLLVAVCSSQNIAHVQGAAMALAEVESPLVDDCLKALSEDPEKDSLIREVAEASIARRAALQSH
jgi:bilin biosynthesis protein|tara:strand:- start:274 stop:891 length:618 start_codon:yes stop_codon:yes gene_type:complete